MLHARRVSRGRGFAGLLVAAALGMGLAGPAAPASGQGTSGELPDPITSRDLDHYARRLNLSDQQRQAIEVLHDDYQVAFRALREGPMEAYLREHGSDMGFRAMTSGDEDSIRKSVNALEDVLGRIRSLDESFFDQVQTVLADDQVERLPAVRQARRRARYQRGMSRMAGFMNPGARVDLGTIMDDLELTTDQRAAVAAVLDTYERRLTSLAQKLHETATRQPLDVSEKMRAAGLSMESFRDRASREALFAIWQEAQDHLANQAAQISELNRRTCRQLVTLLPGEAASAIRRDFIRQAYPEAPSGRGPAARAYAAALELDSISADQRTQIEATRTAYRGRVDHVVDEMLDAIDTRRGSTRMFRFGATESPEEEKHRETMDELRSRYDQINESALADLNALLGEEAAAIVASRTREAEADMHSIEGGGLTAMVMIADGGGANVATISGGSIHLTLDASALEMSDPYLPGPITTAELSAYATRLGIPEDMNDILETLHADYRASFEELRSGEIKAVHDFEQSMWTTDEASGEMRGPDENGVERIFSMRRKALTSILALDRQFFEDLQAALLDDDDAPRLERVRLARERVIYNRAALAGGGTMLVRGPGAGRRNRGISLVGFGASSASSVDLSQLVEGLELEVEQMQRVDPILLDYERSITEQFRRHYDASMKFQEAMDKASAASRVATADGRRQEVRFRGGLFRSVTENEGRVAREIEAELASTNRRVLGELRRHLSEEASDQLRRAFNREAYPGIFQDGRAAGPALEAALTLPDLSPRQRSEIGDIAMAYRVDYDALCERMVEQSGTDEDGQMFDPSRWQRQQERRRELDKIRFERDELSDKVRTRLKSILSAEQASRVGGLGE